jgi:phage gp36-like protein
MTVTRKLAFAAAVFLASTLSACGGTEADVSQTSAAATAQDCQVNISDLRTLTGLVTYKNPAKDLSGLLGKLDNAAAKLTLGKYADAIQKLTDYRNQVVTLAAAGKITAGVDANGNPVTPQDLIAGADAAIACITPFLPPAI